MTCVCAVCGVDYDPGLDLGSESLPFRFIYCSPRCTWSPEPRSPESIRREVDLLRKLLSDRENPN